MADVLLKADDSAFGQYPAYYKARVKQLADALASGKITLDEWQAAMEQELDDLHHAAYMVGSGKQQNLDDQDLAIIAAIVAAQVAFLLNWVKQLKDAKDIQADAIARRADLYLFEADSTIMRAQGEAIGLPELPAYPKNGSTDCLVHCKCHWRIVDLEGQGNFNCYWVMDEAEHCQQCPRRAEVWNPLQVRGGEVQPFDSTGLFAEH